MINEKERYEAETPEHLATVLGCYLESQEAYDKNYDKAVDYIKSWVEFRSQHVRDIAQEIYTSEIAFVEGLRKRVVDNWASTNDRDDERFTVLTKEDKAHNSALDTIKTHLTLQRDGVNGKK